MESRSPSNNIKKSNPLFELSDELILYVFSFLNYKDLVSLSFVCVKTKAVSEDQTLWKPLTKDFFGDSYVTFFSKEDFGLTYKATYIRRAEDLLESLSNFPQEHKSTGCITSRMYKSYICSLLASENEYTVNLNILIQCFLKLAKRSVKNKNGEMIPRLDLNCPGTPFSQTVMHYFATIGEVGILEVLMRNGGSLILKDKNLESPFSLLVQFCLATDYNVEKYVNLIGFFKKIFLHDRVKIPEEILVYGFNQQFDRLNSNPININFFHYLMTLAYLSGNLSELLLDQLHLNFQGVFDRDNFDSQVYLLKPQMPENDGNQSNDSDNEVTYMLSP